MSIKHINLTNKVGFNFTDTSDNLQATLQTLTVEIEDMWLHEINITIKLLIISVTGRCRGADVLCRCSHSNLKVSSKTEQIY